METRTQPILQFEGVDIAEVKASQQQPYNAKDESKNLNFHVSSKVFYPESNPLHFTIITELKVGIEGFFDISLVAFGRFSTNQTAKSSTMKPFIDVNAPAILFPYVRAFLSTLTSNMGTGIPPILLPPQIFAGELAEFEPKKSTD
jgi:preprotein translocase subunit SecB